MQTEIEAKFLNVDHEQIRAKLESAGAKQVEPMRTMIRNNFDYADLQLEKVGGWIRVRDEGNKITMSYKQMNDRTLHGTKEVNLVVDDFKAACDFLISIGLEWFNYQETKRESWRLGSVQVELDEWPWVKPFVEIEAENETDLKEAAAKLDLDFTKAVHGSVEIVYQAEYDVSEADVDSWPRIEFGPAPNWLEVKRK